MLQQLNAHTSVTATFLAQGPTAASRPTTRMEGGQAVFENANYRITAGDNNTVHVQNKRTGETYEAWGDPHMKIDGKQAFDFWGTTTLKLEDGTKVTIETTPWAKDPSMTLSSRVTITDGNYGVQISGIDTNKTGDLRIDEAAGWGRTLDWAVSDGNAMHENPNGQGFVAFDGKGNLRTVDQAHINATDLQKGGKPAPDQAQIEPYAQRFQSALGALGQSLVSMSFFGGLLSSMFSDARSQRHDRDHDRREPAGQRDLQRVDITFYAGLTARWV